MAQMMPNEPIFNHESLQDRKTIKKYLRAITDGMAKGSLSLANGGDELKLSPDGLIHLRVDVSGEDGQKELSIKLDWKEKSTQPKSVSSPLVISSDT